jgi:5-methylcytosine-specific restriction enzyme A
MRAGGRTNMKLTTLKPRLATIATNRAPMLEAKAGATEMERGRAWMAKRHRVALAYNYQCAKCGRTWLSSRDHIDHIVPREQGGSNDESNLQPLCDTPCHAEKSAAEAKARAGR